MSDNLKKNVVDAEMPPPNVMVFVDQASLRIMAPGILQVAFCAHVPSPDGTTLVAGPSIAMPLEAALGMARNIETAFEQVKGLMNQATNPN